MRELAFEEKEAQIKILRSMLSTIWPKLLIPQSTSSSYGALVELKNGVGGSESSLFLDELLRMYVRYAQSKGWSVKANLGSESEPGGLKEASIEVKGEGAYDSFQWESGVHRVQRVPATESSGRVHTSTAAVIVSQPNPNHDCVSHTVC
jgi:peptide chain release factor 1